MRLETHAVTTSLWVRRVCDSAVSLFLIYHYIYIKAANLYRSMAFSSEVVICNETRQERYWCLFDDTIWLPYPLWNSVSAIMYVLNKWSIQFYAMLSPFGFLPYTYLWEQVGWTTKETSLPFPNPLESPANTPLEYILCLSDPLAVWLFGSISSGERIFLLINIISTPGVLLG